MKKLVLSLFALLLAGGLLQAQSLVGTWQGTLAAPQRSLRTVVKISVGADDKLKAVLYSLDQGGQPIPVSSVAMDSGVVKITIPAVNGTYEGKLSADGNTISGALTQGPNPIPLELTRAVPGGEWELPAPPKLMAADAKPNVDVATIKPSDPAQPGMGFTLNPSGMLVTRNTSLFDLVKISFGLQAKQIENMPAWMENDKFDIVAKPDTPGIPSVPQLMGMTQRLLEDRFQLKFHREKKEMPAYILSAGKSPLKISENTTSTLKVPGFGGGGVGGLRVGNATMQELAEFLQAQTLDKPVVDQTGLGDKRYDFVVKWTPDGAPPSDNADAPPDIFAAFAQQLGLSLQSGKAQVETFVIDHVEKPSAN